jgi:hypothetical protein
MKDDSRIELRKAEKNGWAIGFANLRVLKEQLLCKLQAHKAELSRLDRPHGQREVDQNLRAHVEKAVKSRSGGIESTRKKYNDKLKKLALLRGTCGIPRNAWLPSEIKKDGLYQLDVDQDIWQEYDMSDFEEPLKWLTDPEVKEGILLAQTTVTCCSEKQWLVAEQRNLCSWICSEVAVTRMLYASSLSKDIDVAFFALMRLHELHGLLKTWKSVGTGVSDV